MKKAIVITLSLVLFVLLSCRKEKTSWDSDWSMPFVHGELTINDLLPPEFVETNSEDYLSIVYHDTAYSFSLDTLVEFPDTTVVDWVDLVLFSFMTVDPDYSLLTSLADQYDLGELYFKRIIVKSGEASVEIASPWQGKSKMVAGFSNFYEAGGVSFERSFELEAGSLGSPTVVSETADIANLDMVLSGVSGIGLNEVETFLKVSSNEATASYTVNNPDSIKFTLGFKNIIPKYAKGYFGQHNISDTIGISLSPMKKIIGGSIDIDSVAMTVSILNGFNLIAQTTITKMTGVNTRTLNEVDLTFPQLGNSININPATGGLSSHTSSVYPINIDNLNSNIVEFIENLSDSISFGFELNINPYGNVSGGNDEFYPTSSFDLYVDAEFPLNFSANQLTLVDTFDIIYTPIESLTPGTGTFTMTYENGFPLEALPIFYLLDAQDAIIDSLVTTTVIQSGSYNMSTYLTTPTKGALIYTFSLSAIDNLELAEKIMLKVSFSTENTDKVRIDASSFFNFNLRTNLQITTRL